MTHALQSATYGSATKMITRFNVLFLVCYVLNEMPIELRYEHVLLTMLGVSGQQCCVRLHGALVISAERTRPSELSWFLHL